MAKQNVRAWAAGERKSAKRSGEKAHPAAAGGSWIWPATRLALYDRGAFACAYCMVGAEDGNPLSLDHVVAVELGGGNGADNLVCACLRCNSKKRALSLRGFLAMLRDEGVDTSGIALRVRAQLSRPLDRARGRALVSARRAA